MPKRTLAYIITFGVAFLTTKFLHTNFLLSQNITVNFSLFNVYAFHAVFSFLVCIIFSLMARKEKLFQQLGFIYLAVLVLKIIVFVAVFYKSIFSMDNLSKTDSISLLIPIGVFLTLEVYFIARILNSK